MTNEQKYKTTDERIRAFWRFCKEHGQKGKHGCLGCPAKGLPTYREKCALTWLAFEVEEEKPLACPFCGGDSIDIFETDFGRSEEPYQFAVKCKSCGALVSAEDKDDAIAAWTRRAK